MVKQKQNGYTLALIVKMSPQNPLWKAENEVYCFMCTVALNK